MSGKGYEFAPHELNSQIAALGALGDQTNGLVNSARRLAERLPPLGTAPPALHLAMRLRQAAGETGLSGEVGAANTELANVHEALKTTMANYLDSEQAIARSFREAGSQR
jgi:hypothetical protein